MRQMRQKKRQVALKLWAKALGEKASPQKTEADIVALIRTTIFLSYLITNAFIIAGVIRHWNDQEFSPPQNATDQLRAEASNAAP
jgi:hypothetical protein